ncbi:hypothetical protein OSI08_20315 [Mycobacterium ulcerans]
MPSPHTTSDLGVSSKGHRDLESVDGRGQRLGKGTDEHIVGRAARDGHDQAGIHDAGGNSGPLGPQPGHVVSQEKARVRRVRRIDGDDIAGRKRLRSHHDSRDALVPQHR